MPEDFPTDFREYGERQLPPHLVLYQRAVDIAHRKLVEAQEVADKAYQNEVADVGFLIHLKDTLHPVALSGLGVDAIKLDSINFERFDEDDSQRRPEEFEAIVIRALFYQDGSPCVLEGDTLDPATVGHARALNMYNIVLMAENPPVAVQYALMDFLESDKWPGVNKHELTIEDSQALVAVLDTAEIDPNDVITLADYYPKDPDE